MEKQFVPNDFNVPSSKVEQQYILEVLEPKFLELDYAAVMSSRKRLRSVFDEVTDWPADGMTIDENLNDLVRHKKEFDNREAFAYTVLNPQKDTCIGCVYIQPSPAPEHDADVFFWVTDEKIELDGTLFEDLQNWLNNDWPFAKIAFPGRTISWEQWHSITAN